MGQAYRRAARKGRQTHPSAPSGQPRLVIVRETGAKHDARDALELGEPLSEVAWLTIDLRYSNRELIDVEVCFHDPLLGGMTDILYRWDIVFGGNSLRLCEKATCNVSDQLKVIK
jgi:hypothetical protein